MRKKVSGKFMIKLELPPPEPEREDLYSEKIKPLLDASMENNAVDKWMFNLTESGEVDRESVIYVSTKHMKIFIIKYISETEQPPPIELDADDKALKKHGLSFDTSHLPDEVARKYKRDRERSIRSFHRSRYGLPRTVKTQKRNGTVEDELQKWSAGLFYWDISNEEYIGTSWWVKSSSNIPTLEELCEDLDLDCWANMDRNQIFTYQEVSKKWKEKQEH